MLQIVEFIAVISGTFFAGAALYINLVEHPARMQCDTAEAVRQWVPSYKRATVMQASLAAISCVAGIAAWPLGGSPNWVVGALIIGAVVPYTYLFVLPVNRKLLDPERDTTTVDTRLLLDQWARLHSTRTLLSAIAASVYVGLLVAR